MRIIFFTYNPILISIEKMSHFYIMYPFLSPNVIAKEGRRKMFGISNFFSRRFRERLMDNKKDDKNNFNIYDWNLSKHSINFFGFIFVKGKIDKIYVKQNF